MLFKYSKRKKTEKAAMPTATSPVPVKGMTMTTEVDKNGSWGAEQSIWEMVARLDVLGGVRATAGAGRKGVLAPR